MHAARPSAVNSVDRHQHGPKHPIGERGRAFPCGARASMPARYILGNTIKAQVANPTMVLPR